MTVTHKWRDKMFSLLTQKEVVILNTFLAWVISNDEKEPKITYLKTNYETV